MKPAKPPMIGRTVYITDVVKNCSNTIPYLGHCAATASTAFCLQELDRVAQLRGALVELFCNRSFHLAPHDLQLGKRASGFHFLEPFVEKRDLGTLRHQLRKEIGR